MDEARLNGVDAALVTGGYGFIGSNLATALSNRDVSVTVLDTMGKPYGSNPANLDLSDPNLEHVHGDVRDEKTVRDVASDVDVVFHLAAQLSRPRSLEDPRHDIDVNCNGTITVLETLKRENPTASLVFTGSQAEFGVPDELPLSEDVAERPIDVYGANKLAAEHYCDVYREVHGIDCTTLRLSNVYGPRANLQNVNYGVINKFLRLALEDEQLTVFEPGTMKRDPIFVGDVVRALIAAATTPSTERTRSSYVVGTGEPVTVRGIAEHIVEVAGSGTVEIVPWPDDWDSIRVGDLYMDPSAAMADLDWEPTVSFEDGLEETVAFYLSHWDAYLDPDR